MPSRQPGALVGNRYEVLGYLGHGGFGEVYKVLDRHQQTHVALKLLNNVSGIGVWGEAQILTDLRSPYILEVRNADFDSGVPFLVTELAAHGSADAHMEPLPVPPEDAVRWTRAACRGVARTHSANLLHRDIKPANLFLTAEGEARLGDFGVAHLMDENGLAPATGTLATMAPEVAAGHPVSVVSEVYSLGATLYALLAGQYAHQNEDPTAFRASIVNDPLPALRDLAPHVPQAVSQRVSRAMAKDPADRLPNPTAFAAELGELPLQNRDWRQTDEHHGHSACWRGEGSGKTPATVCLIPAGTRWEVVSCHQPSSRKISAACRGPAPPSSVPRNLRAAMKAVP